MITARNNYSQFKTIKTIFVSLEEAKDEVYCNFQINSDVNFFDISGVQIFEETFQNLEKNSVLYVVETDETFPINAFLSDFTKIKFLWKGSFGEVLHVKHSITGIERALKIIHNSHISTEKILENEVLNDALILKRFNH